MATYVTQSQSPWNFLGGMAGGMGQGYMYMDKRRRDEEERRWRRQQEQWMNEQRMREHQLSRQRFALRGEEHQFAKEKEETRKGELAAKITREKEIDLRDWGQTQAEFQFKQKKEEQREFEKMRDYRADRDEQFTKDAIKLRETTEPWSMGRATGLTMLMFRYGRDVMNPADMALMSQPKILLPAERSAIAWGAIQNKGGGDNPKMTPEQAKDYSKVNAGYITEAVETAGEALMSRIPGAKLRMEEFGMWEDEPQGFKTIDAASSFGVLSGDTQWFVPEHEYEQLLKDFEELDIKRDFTLLLNRFAGEPDISPFSTSHADITQMLLYLQPNHLPKGWESTSREDLDKWAIDYMKDVRAGKYKKIESPSNLQNLRGGPPGGQPQGQQQLVNRPMPPTMTQDPNAMPSPAMQRQPMPSPVPQRQPVPNVIPPPAPIGQEQPGVLPAWAMQMGLTPQEQQYVIAAQSQGIPEQEIRRVLEQGRQRQGR